MKITGKRCMKCGALVQVWSPVRRCPRPVGMLGSYACWGQLVTEKETPMPRQRMQDVAAKKLAHARKMVAEKTRAMRRLATALHHWEKAATHYAKRASLTDAEVEAERANRLARVTARKKARVTRGFALKEDA